jgi:hypothetical protein
MAHWNPPQSDYSTEVSDHLRDRRSKPWLLLLLVSLSTALLFYAVVAGAVLFNAFIGGGPP